MFRGFKKKIMILGGHRTEVLVPVRRISHEQAWKEMKPILDRVVARMNKK